MLITLVCLLTLLTFLAIVTNRQLANRISAMEILYNKIKHDNIEFNKKIEKLNPHIPILESIRKGEKDFLRGLRKIESAIEEDLHERE